MGCCPAFATSSTRKKPKDEVIDPQKVSDVKQRLKAEKLNNSLGPMSEETLALLRKAKAQPFNCRFIGLMHIHNYLMFLRDKSGGIIRDAS